MNAVITNARAIVPQSTASDPVAGSGAARADGEPADRTADDGAIRNSAAAAESLSPRRAATLPIAPFVAQLIANQQGLPQTRARNRVEPATAALAYRTAGRRS